MTQIGLHAGARRALRYDVVVVGGGAAGVAAAVGAARRGARTLLVERYGFLGGEAANANVLSYCGFFVAGERARLVVGGVGQAVLGELAALGFDTTPIRAPSGNWIVMLDPEAIKRALDRVTTVPGLDCRLHAHLVAAHRAGPRIAGVTVHDAAGTLEVEATAFVDASGDAVLGFAAGAPAIADAEPARARQVASFPVRFGGVAPDAIVARAALAARMPRFDNGAGPARVRDHGGHFIRLPGSNDLWWMGIDAVTGGLDSADLAAAERGARTLAWRFLDFVRAALPGFAHAYIVATGPQLGIRDSRQIVPRYRLTDDDLATGRRRDDGVAFGCWPAEVHAAGRAPRFAPVGGDGTYDIPVAALRATGIDNLWLAGRTIGCDEGAYGSLRVMGTAFATGHAAGVAATFVDPASGEPDIVAIRAELARQGAML
jgi:hypothetical protein